MGTNTGPARAEAPSRYDLGELSMPQAMGVGAQEEAKIIDLSVTSIGIEADGILSLVLEQANKAPLPEWEPGAHVDLVLGNGLVRQYSLCGDPGDASAWRLGILREPKSRGGSEYIHTRLSIGTRLAARGPRNHFPLVEARTYLFIAGGIGITPLLPMISRVDAAGADWKLLYGGRTTESMAFLGKLSRYGNRVLLHPQDRYGLLDIEAFLASAAHDTQLYCCGPEPLIAAVEAASAAYDFIDLHVERFAAKEVEAGRVDEPFELECAASGTTLQVPPGKTIMEVARAAGINILSSCSEGICGTCETDVIEGIPDHRDSILTPEERRRNETMMVCVSRCIGKRLVLDL